MTSITNSETTCAVILAAGEGIRLGPLGKKIPKGMLRLGGRTIIEESIARLTRAGIRRVVIVTGHLSEQFHVLREAFPEAVALVHNPDYRLGGSLSTLVTSFEHVDGDFLLLESDIVYEQRALSALLGRSDESVVLVSGETSAGDEVWVSAYGEPANWRLAAMSKRRDELSAPVVGELVGICRVTRSAIPALCDCLRTGRGRGKPIDYELGLVHAATQAPFSVTKIDDLIWAEIDTMSMLDRVARDVYPLVAQRDLEETGPRG